MATGEGPNWDATEAAARAEGDLSFADRPAAVQVAMERMYRNDGTFSSLSALFVDQSPGDTPSSVEIYIRQPDTVRTAAYPNTDGIGAPSEIVVGEGSTVTMYAPQANTYTKLGRVLSSRLMDLPSVPLSVVQKEYSGTTIYAGAFGGPAPVLADMMIHPASLLTSPFFTNKRIGGVETGALDGRAVWVMSGTQAPHAATLGSLGDGWRMWVDKRTGIVLRLEYYSSTSLLGAVELRNLEIDGPPSSGESWLAAWVLPEGARFVASPIAYNRLAQSRGS